MGRVWLALFLLSSCSALTKVYCEYPDDCPPAINQLQFKNKRCTAFLVARDLIATNRHCLPSDMNKEILTSLLTKVPL